jgi:arylsulfatase A
MTPRSLMPARFPRSKPTNLRRGVSGFAGLLLLAFFFGGGWGLSGANAARRPNILVILADDMGIGDLSCLNPQSAWKTPALDRLAREGRIFTDAHCASGVCTPSRYALLTGRYPWRGRLKQGVLRGYDPALIEPGRLTVPGLLRQHGYVTAMVGKWHLGIDWVKTGPALEAVDFSRPYGGGPTAHGFDSFFGISASLDMPAYYYMENDRVVQIPSGQVAASLKPPMWRAGPISPDFRHEDVLGRLVERSLSFLDERAQAKDGKPFFLYLALTAPHTPIVPTSKFRGRSGTNAYGDFAMEVDARVGEVLERLDATGQGERTLVIFTADNGFAPVGNLPELRSFGHEPSAGFRGHKADLYEGGTRIPFLARWPGVVPAGTRSGALIAQVDLLATCAELVGARLPDASGEDSVSHLSALSAGSGTSPERTPLVIQSSNGSFAIREGRWKLCLCPGSGGWSYPHPEKDDTSRMPRFQLYDLEKDPGETRNVVDSEVEVVQRLGRRLRSYIESGRSTPGAPQPTVRADPWPQVAWMSEFGP